MDINDEHFSRPYMGNLTSAQIGQMARAGELGGEMVRRMIAHQETQMMNVYNQSHMDNTIDNSIK